MSRANGDLVNLLAGVQIAIVFVTSDLRIRRFTPMAEKALNLIASDVGRPIGNIRPNIDCPDLETLIKDAVDNVVVKEREVQDREGNWMLLRIRPYKSLDNRIDGAVLVLLDIDALRKQEQRGQQAQDLAGAILESFERPMMVLDAEMRVVAANRLLTQMLRLGHPDVVGKPLTEIVSADWDVEQLKARIAKIRPGDRPLDLFDVPREIAGSGHRKVLLRARKFEGGSRRAPLSLLSIEEPALA
jgi:two-component system CheB/CheR fusion protein